MLKQFSHIIIFFFTKLAANPAAGLAMLTEGCFFSKFSIGYKTEEHLHSCTFRFHAK